MYIYIYVYVYVYVCVYVYVYACAYAYAYVYVYIHTDAYTCVCIRLPPTPEHSRLPPYVGVCEKTLLLRKLLTCSPAAETALQPLIWCFRNQYVHASPSSEEWFFTDTGITDETSYGGRLPADNYLLV